MPGSLLSQYAPVNGASVPFRRHTANCSALSSRRHYSSVLFMSFANKWSSSLIHAMHASRQLTDHRLGDGGDTPSRVLGLAISVLRRHQRGGAVTVGGDDAAFLHVARDELGDLV